MRCGCVAVQATMDRLLDVVVAGVVRAGVVTRRRRCCCVAADATPDRVLAAVGARIAFGARLVFVVTVEAACATPVPRRRARR